ncbi:26992_t:CDS:1, partial [Dentiscutata erythropus]
CKKKPPHPPNAFILYRQAKQPAIVATNMNISNNEVLKRVGDMWHKESLEVKIKFQLLADIAKLEHMQKYPEYKYQPRRPHEKKRRTKRNCHLSINEISSRPNQEQKTGICDFSKTKSKTIHENHSQHGEINSENNNELVNQNVDEYNFQLIGNNLNLSNEISENSQEIT